MTQLHTTIPQSAESESAGSEALQRLRHAIEHATHVLPAQGPITIFVHHNTLHAFEELPFEDAVLRGLKTYRCQPYLSEPAYRAKVAEGRIRSQDLDAVLLDDLGDLAEVLIGFMGTRFHLRQAMLTSPLTTGTDAEIRWLIAESDALTRFRPDISNASVTRLVDQTRQWMNRLLQDGAPAQLKNLAADVLTSLPGGNPEHWSRDEWNTVTLNLLWEVCRLGCRQVSHPPATDPAAVRPRDMLREMGAADTDAIVHELLIPFTAAYLDQGFAEWTLPDRDGGFLQSFRLLCGSFQAPEPWLRDAVHELDDLATRFDAPLQIISAILTEMGVEPDEMDPFVTQTLLALRGWAGMLWQMETNAGWAVHPASAGSLLEFLAVRLVLDKCAAEHIAREWLDDTSASRRIIPRLRSCLPRPPGATELHTAWQIFQLAQIRGWCPQELFEQSPVQWRKLISEITTFDSLERRRVYHLAFERRYRIAALDAISVAAKRPDALPNAPRQPAAWQIVTCIDDREESFRRYLEEIDPSCETFAAAGFYAVAIYFRGATDAHYRPLCPVVITPQHYVREEVAYSLTSSSRQRQQARRMLGKASHRWHMGSRGIVGGMVTAVLGSLASIPLIGRILFPHLTSRIRRFAGTLLHPGDVTELHLERDEDPPGPDDRHLGFRHDEMAAIVERMLRDNGLTTNFADVIVFLGHGSGSLNNPHESAYNCGACSGGRGGPNARAFAQMANDPQVRRRLAANGLTLPETTIFIGGFHNTCDEDVTYYDLDRVPRHHRPKFEQIRAVIDQARARNAQERCRRFESAPLDLTPAEALEHVETRAEDLSQARPEYNHATCAMVLVGRRQWSRGLFLDRRAFLNSYDPAQDDENGTILARILSAAVPVCAGISLEYYFSCVDPAGYGCGSKLPHNITSLLGVMEGAASDLRPGLSQQMIEIHEPLRALFVVETTTKIMQRIIDGNPVIRRLVVNDWVQLAILDPESGRIFEYRSGEFVAYRPESTDLPQVASSYEWYHGRRDHLGFAEVVGSPSPSPSPDPEHEAGASP